MINNNNQINFNHNHFPYPSPMMMYLNEEVIFTIKQITEYFPSYLTKYRQEVYRCQEKCKTSTQDDNASE